MLQYPTNLYPDGATFDPSVLDDKNKITFTFNGDILSGVAYKIYDYDTGEIIRVDNKLYPQRQINADHTPIKYNGETLSTTGYLDELEAGKDYGLQLELVQFTADGTKPLCDMFVLRGLTQADYTPHEQDDYITIKSNIDNIYEWDTEPIQGVRKRNFDEWGIILDQMEIVIGGERKAFWGYNTISGNILLLESFDEPIPAGTPFQIYCNYKISPLYFFKCRSNPTAALTLSVVDPIDNVDVDMHFNVTGTYAQTESSLINYYTIALYWSDTNGSSRWRKIDETEKIYSQQIGCGFWDDFVLRYEYSGAAETYALYYKAVMTLVTVDGMSIVQESNVLNVGGDISQDVPTTTTTLYPYDLDRADVSWEAVWLKQGIRIVYAKSGVFDTGTRVLCYRENLKTGETVMVNNLYDATIPNKGEFRYYIVPRSSSGRALLNSISWADYTSNMNGYTITELILAEDTHQWGQRLRYKIGDSWKFVGDVQNTTVTQNTDKYLHVSYAKYPTQTFTKTNYMSGTISAMLGYVDCITNYGTRKYEDNIELVNAWREFITRPSMFMIKSPKGDVWIANITDNPTTTYDDSMKDLITTISFSWAECCNVNDIIILGYTQGT